MTCPGLAWVSTPLLSSFASIAGKRSVASALVSVSDCKERIEGWRGGWGEQHEVGPLCNARLHEGCIYILLVLFRPYINSCRTGSKQLGSQPEVEAWLGGQAGLASIPSLDS